MLDREIIETKERVESLRLRLAESDLDCFLVTNLNNLFYLTGLRSSAGAARAALPRGAAATMVGAAEAAIRSTWRRVMAIVPPGQK